MIYRTIIQNEIKLEKFSLVYYKKYLTHRISYIENVESKCKCIQNSADSFFQR